MLLPVMVAPAASNIILSFVGVYGGSAQSKVISDRTRRRDSETDISRRVQAP